MEAGLLYVLMTYNAKHIYAKEMNHVEHQWSAILIMNVPSKIVHKIISNQIWVMGMMSIMSMTIIWMISLRIIWMIKDQVTVRMHVFA